MVTGDSLWCHGLFVLWHPSDSILMLLERYPAAYYWDSALLRASGIHLCKELGALEDIWGPWAECSQEQAYFPPHPGPPSNPSGFTVSEDSHESPARMLTCDSHLTVMLASAGAQFGNYRRFLCLYMSKTRKSGNTAQLNVCPVRVQLPGLGLACLFISFFHSLSPTVCLVVPGASLTTGPLSPMHSPPVPSFSLLGPGGQN